MRSFPAHPCHFSRDSFNIAAVYGNAHSLSCSPVLLCLIVRANAVSRLSPLFDTRLVFTRGGEPCLCRPWCFRKKGGRPCTVRMQYGACSFVFRVGEGRSLARKSPGRSSFDSCVIRDFDVVAAAVAAPLVASRCVTPFPRGDSGSAPFRTALPH